MDREFNLIRRIIENGIWLDISTKNLLSRIRSHFDKSNEFQTRDFHFQAFLIYRGVKPAAKITIENNLLTFDFAVEDQVFPVIMETLKFLNKMRWN